MIMIAIIQKQNEMKNQIKLNFEQPSNVHLKVTILIYYNNWKKRSNKFHWTLNHSNGDMQLKWMIAFSICDCQIGGSMVRSSRFFFLHQIAMIHWIHSVQQICAGRCCKRRFLRNADRVIVLLIFYTSRANSIKSIWYNPWTWKHINYPMGRQCLFSVVIQRRKWVSCESAKACNFKSEGDLTFKKQRFGLPFSFNGRIELRLPYAVDVSDTALVSAAS